MSGLLWKLALAGTAYAAIRAYRRNTHTTMADAASSMPPAELDEGRATPPHGDALQGAEPTSTTAATNDPDGAVPA
ncbi:MULTISPECIES: hypothetical protein [unclassified Xanthomonas]|uniref:hypothetical protein n=1 Tax=unclassified Xanthomonas TaxID=2643310 RepID=UPI0025D35126|nr:MULTISPECIES: hypothetical protein [unclassified Xanthomonas]MDY4296283.1 hypothetical protein [Xanthomonas sp. LF02-5]MDY4358043.1 hypothetical protein [Xanthomonas sp. LF04-12]